ncbi:MAG TPA: hypothetical protein VGK23_05950, partial [Methanomassiliicoccales archaeon]
MTVQFFQLEFVPAVEVALMEIENDPEAVGVPDNTVPDQEAQEGLAITDMVEDSLTVGVYE